MSDESGWSHRALAAVGALVLGAIGMVAFSIRRPELPVFAPSPILAPGAAADSTRSDGTRVLTVDSSDPERWRYVSLARGTVVEEPGPGGWDLALRRFEMRVNGGAGSGAGAGIADLGEVALDSVRALPEAGYVGMEARGRDTLHTVLDEWYSYSFTSHVLRPRPRSYAVRTAAGRHAALEFVSYYCTGAQPGCVTMRYRFMER